MSEEAQRGSTFWDWFTGSHTTLRRTFMVLGLLVILYGLYRYRPIYAAVLIAAFVLGYLICRGMLFTDESVRVIALNPECPTEVSLRFVGKRKFQILSKDGNPQAFSTSAGEPVYIAERMDDESMGFAWIHETSRWRFITQSDAFDRVRDIADDSLKQLLMIRHIPRSLGMIEASEMINHYDHVMDGILKDDVSAEDIIDDLMDLDDPLQEDPQEEASEQ